MALSKSFEATPSTLRQGSEEMNFAQNISIRNRKILYVVAGSALFGLTVFGVVSPDNVPQILNIVGGVLGVGAFAVALPNVPKE